MSDTRWIRVPAEVEPNPDQLAMPVGELTPAERKLSIQEQFALFHARNPHIYRLLVGLAREWVEAGHERCGIGMLFEVLRFRRGVHTSGDDFKLNNNYRSRYSRLIESEEPDLAGLFETRELRAA